MGGTGNFIFVPMIVVAPAPQVAATWPISRLAEIMVCRLAGVNGEDVRLVRLVPVLVLGGTTGVTYEDDAVTIVVRYNGTLDDLRAKLEVLIVANWQRLVLDASEVVKAALTPTGALLDLVTALRALVTSPPHPGAYSDPTYQPIVTIAYMVDSVAQWEFAPWVLGPTADLELVCAPLLAPEGPDVHVSEEWVAWCDEVWTAWTSVQGFVDAAATPPAVLVDDAVRGFKSLRHSMVEFANEGWGMAPLPADTWPLDAVRLRIPEVVRHALIIAPPWAGTVDPQALVALDRCTRGTTGRRVGLSISGGGALSYVGVPFIQALIERGVPIDVLSGTSGGTWVAAFYAACGERGLKALVDHWYCAQITVLYAYVLNQSAQAWIDFDCGFRKLEELELNLVPMSTAAKDGYESMLRSGAMGQVCVASGAIPPLAPAYAGASRLLDGALSAELPILAAKNAGANIAVGMSVVPLPVPVPQEPLWWPPVVWAFVRTLNPVRRMADLIRGDMMMYRETAGTQVQAADVLYNAPSQGFSAGEFYNVSEIIAAASATPEFTTAVNDTVVAWEAIAGTRKGVVRPYRRPAGGTVLIWSFDEGATVGPYPVRVDPLSALGFAAAQPELHEAAAWMKPWLWARVEVRASSAASAGTVPLHQFATKVFDVLNAVAPGRVTIAPTPTQLVTAESIVIELVLTRAP